MVVFNLTFVLKIVCSRVVPCSAVQLLADEFFFDEVKIFRLAHSMILSIFLNEFYRTKKKH